MHAPRAPVLSVIAHKSRGSGPTCHIGLHSHHVLTSTNSSGRQEWRRRNGDQPISNSGSHAMKSNTTSKFQLTLLAVALAGALGAAWAQGGGVGAGAAGGAGASAGASAGGVGGGASAGAG